jgi:PiT family inorganic phosphate transporter
MVGWKRIVVTVGEKIGKTHLTYAQGASAELVAAATIGAADMFGLPVSTTHVLSSGVAGTMAANGSGLQMATIRNLVMAWVLTLPAAILISGSLYVIFAERLHAASVFSTSLTQYEVPNTIASSLKS